MADAVATTRRKQRPLSPHLQIYRWPVTMLTSIVHRITGVGLGLGSILVAWWLIAAASGYDAYASFAGVAGSWIGKLILFGFTAALIFHLFNGIRHLFWDAGAGFEKSRAELTGIIVIAATVLVTVLLWTAVFIMRAH